MRVHAQGRSLFLRDDLEDKQIVFVEAPLGRVTRNQLPQLLEVLNSLEQKGEIEYAIHHHAALLTTALTEDIQQHIGKLGIPAQDDPINLQVRNETELVFQRLCAMVIPCPKVSKNKWARICAIIQKGPASIEYVCRLNLAWRTNSYKLVDNAGIILYRWSSLMAHSCCPNVAIYSHDVPGDRMVLTTKQFIEANSEITISYLSEEDLGLPTHIRQKKILQSWGFQCRCVACGGGGRVAPAAR